MVLFLLSNLNLAKVLCMKPRRTEPASPFAYATPCSNQLRPVARLVKASHLYPYRYARPRTESVTGTATAQYRLEDSVMSRTSAVFMPKKPVTKDLRDQG